MASNAVITGFGCHPRYPCYCCWYEIPWSPANIHHQIANEIKRKEKQIRGKRDKKNGVCKDGRKKEDVDHLFPTVLLVGNKVEGRGRVNRIGKWLSLYWNTN